MTMDHCIEDRRRSREGNGATDDDERVFVLIIHDGQRRIVSPPESGRRREGLQSGLSLQASPPSPPSLPLSLSLSLRLRSGGFSGIRYLLLPLRFASSFVFNAHCHSIALPPSLPRPARAAAQCLHLLPLLVMRMEMESVPGTC